MLLLLLQHEGRWLPDKWANSTPCSCECEAECKMCYRAAKGRKITWRVHQHLNHQSKAEDGAAEPEPEPEPREVVAAGPDAPAAAA